MYAYSQDSYFLQLVCVALHLEVSISHKEAMGQLLSSEKGGLMRADVMDMEKGSLLVHVS